MLSFFLFYLSITENKDFFKHQVKRYPEFFPSLKLRKVWGGAWESAFTISSQLILPFSTMVNTERKSDLWMLYEAY